MSSSGHNDYARSRSERRKASRDRIHVHVLHPIDTPSLLRDPLAHNSSRLRGTFDTIKLVVVAAAVHAMIIALLYAASDLLGEDESVHKREVVSVTVVDVPVKKPREQKEEPETMAPLAPDFAVVAEKQEPLVTPPKRRRTPKKVVAKPEPKAETKPVIAPPRRYRPGISMESTVGAGKGPAMQTGDSRMGKTSTTASGPSSSPASVAGKTGGTGRTSGGAGGDIRQQRKAANIPSQGSVFVKPKRVSPSKAPYPKTLEAQGIEGDVKVRVSVDASGQVAAVAVVGSSGHKAFDDAAKRAARREKFKPATRDGRAVSFTISYSYRFRIKEK